MDDNRFIKLSKACNFREIGGLNTTGGKRTRMGILYRSDELSQLNANDRRIFASLNIRTIIDLRGVQERMKKLDNIPSEMNVNVLNIPIDHSNQDLKQVEFYRFLINKSQKFDFEKYMKEHYFGTAFECTEQIKKILTLLSDRKNLPALLHCTVGKDRTGYMSALLQLLAGVPRSIVVDEYTATNRFIGNRTKKIIWALRIISFFRAPIEKIQPMLEVRSHYLSDVLDEMFKRHGTVENYLLEACGVDNETQLKLKNLMLE